MFHKTIWKNVLARALFNHLAKRNQRLIIILINDLYLLINT